MLKLNELSLEQKIGLVLCSRRTHLPEDMDTTLDMIRNHAVGCVQIRLNQDTPQMVRKMQDAADYPILFINDMERGYPASDLPLIPAMTLAACNNPDYLRDFAVGIVAAAKADGVSGTWGPVLDILTENRPCTVSRRFGNTVEAVTRAAEIIAKVFAENRFLCGGKHYPGDSGAIVDTHMVEGKSQYTREDLLSRNLIPFMELAKQGLLSGVMTSHTVFPNIDPDYPATLSPKVIGILRETGYDGLIYTDSLAMMGILQKYGEAHAMGLALAAGNDIILPNYRTPHKVCVEMMMDEYRKGTFTEAHLNDAVRRIINAMDYITQPVENPAVITDKVRASYKNIARDAVTAVTDPGICAALPNPEKRRLFIVLTEEDFNAEASQQEISMGQWYFPTRIAEYIRENFPASEVAFMREFPNATENELLLTCATGFDEVVFCTFCMTSAYVGTDCMTRRAEAVINALIDSDKVSAVVHFGNPYAVEPLHHVSRFIFGYSAPESQKYAIEVLAGKIPALGKLPFTVNLA